MTLICSNCLHEIHRSDPKRYVGAYVTHSHERCIELLRLSTIDLQRRLREAQEERDTLRANRDAMARGEVEALRLYGQEKQRALAAEQKAARMERALRAVVERRDAHGYTSVNKRADDMAAIARAALGSTPGTCPHGFDYISCHVCERAERSES